MPLTRSADLQFRKGTVQFTTLALQRTVTFTEPFPPEISTDYEIFWQTPNLSVSVGIMSKTAAGFTINVGLNLNLTTMDLNYYAVERR